MGVYSDDAGVVIFTYFGGFRGFFLLFFAPSESKKDKYFLLEYTPMSVTIKDTGSSP